MNECQQRKREKVPGLRVLVVEDEFIVALTLKVQLEAMGCQVVGTVRDGSEAIRQAQELRPDVVLMDIGLSGSDGVEATQKIVAEVPTQVIVVTAYGDDRVEQAMQAGARLALTKPIVEEQLAQAIAEVTAGRGNDGNDAREALSP